MKKSLSLLLPILLAFSPVYANEQITIKINDLNLDLIKCPSGNFFMGSPANELGRNTNTELEQYQSKIEKDYYIGKYEVSQALYQAVMKHNPSKNTANENPVERVSFYDAIKFCNKLNDLTEKDRPKGYKFTLPTEQQWEYACRAGTNSALNNSKQLSTAKGKCDEIEEIAWYKANSDTKTHPVGSKKPNSWGIYDMHGNVAEWCLDSFNGNEKAEEINNNSKCVIRGGAYFYEPEKLRSASRGANSPSSISSGFGIRVALVQEENIELPKIDLTETKEIAVETTEKTPIKEEPSNAKVATISNTEVSSKVEEPIQTNEIKNVPIKTDEQPKAKELDIKAGVKISISTNGVKFPLIGCPAGEFMMGSPNDKTQHKQIIDKGFYIGKYEITQGQYKAIMGNNPSIITGDKLPVHNINWLDADKFCKKLNELTADKRPAGYEFSLPNEVQWEYACRSGYNTSLNNGKNLTNFKSSDNELNKICWYEANSCEKIQTVGKKVANAWGIHDMLGNIWEYCSNNTKIEDNKTGNHRVIRGGGYKSKPEDCICSSRKIIEENLTKEEVGFRVILRQKE